ncbi:nitrilase [Galdieria sulphuraria]|uniref:Nitrilase n=1 Tax=Galdieria sulphuraria TaxID=130081 RepID=M2Y5R7_GALSU|nr:nitrilase [Galdieria sulphuraria]EME31199.1 nitrilase [Galdieria sulphuraria]|eukprot:XP_005707719.1 nitrilase [Galdieria sulphuraria]
MVFGFVSFLPSKVAFGCHTVISTLKGLRITFLVPTQLSRKNTSSLRNFSTTIRKQHICLDASQEMANMKNFKIALCQILSSDNKDANILKALEAVDEAAKRGAELVVLPECFNSPYDNSAFLLSMLKKFLSPEQAARKNHVYLVGGSIPERDGSKLYNCSPVFSPKGELLAKHRKIHLFDVDVPGGIRFFESETLSPGNCITVVRTELGNIGVAICYDIRFPELSMAMAREGACILCLPAAFNMTTGPAHWELLMRSRALDNQMYVAACGPARNESASYQAWGHSMIASPWGDIVISTEFQEDLLISEVKKELVQKTRVSIPLSKQRRSDLYELQYSLKSM